MKWNSLGRPGETSSCGHATMYRTTTRASLLPATLWTEGQTALSLSVTNNCKFVAYTFQCSILWQKEGFIPIKGSFALIKSHFSGLIFLWKHPRSLSPPQSIPVLSNAAQPQRTSSSLALLVQPLERQWHTGHSCWPQGHHHPQGGGKFLPCPEFPAFLNN